MDMVCEKQGGARMTQHFWSEPLQEKGRHLLRCRRVENGQLYLGGGVAKKGFAGRNNTSIGIIKFGKVVHGARTWMILISIRMDAMSQGKGR